MWMCPNPFVPYSVTATDTRPDAAENGTGLPPSRVGFRPRTVGARDLHSHRSPFRVTTLGHACPDWGAVARSSDRHGDRRRLPRPRMYHVPAATDRRASRPARRPRPVPGPLRTALGRSCRAMNLDQLQNASKKDLTDRAQSLGIAGYSAMSKDELVQGRHARAEEEGKGTGKGQGRRQGQAGSAPAASRRSTASTTSTASRPPPAVPRGQEEGRSRRPEPAPAVDPSGKPPAAPPGRARQGPDRRHGPRPVLAARLLGADPPVGPAGRGGPRPGLARGPADPAPVRRQRPGHDQHVRGRRPRHRHPRRLQQLVHRRDPAAAVVPGGHRLPVQARPVLRPGPVERRHHRRRPASATRSTRTGPTRTPSRPTASTPCRAGSTRRPATRGP